MNEKSIIIGNLNKQEIKPFKKSEIQQVKWLQVDIDKCNSIETTKVTKELLQMAKDNDLYAFPAIDKIIITRQIPESWIEQLKLEQSKLYPYINFVTLELPLYVFSTQKKVNGVFLVKRDDDLLVPIIYLEIPEYVVSKYIDLPPILSIYENTAFIKTKRPIKVSIVDVGCNKNHNNI